MCTQRTPVSTYQSICFFTLKTVARGVGKSIRKAIRSGVYLLSFNSGFRIRMFHEANAKTKLNHKTSATWSTSRPRSFVPKFAPQGADMGGGGG